MNDDSHEVPETEFLKRVAANVPVTRRQLRHLKRCGKIRGGCQTYVPGRRGSVTYYLASEVDRVVELLTAKVSGRRSVAKASVGAWLENGEATLPRGQSSWDYVVSELESFRDRITETPVGRLLLQFTETPVDQENADDDTRGEQAYNLADELLATVTHREHLPLFDLVFHCMLVRNYIDVTEFDEVRQAGASFGPLFDPTRDHFAFTDRELREPVQGLLLWPREYLRGVSNTTVERSRCIHARMCDIFDAFCTIPDTLRFLRQPLLPFAYVLQALGRAMSPFARVLAPFITAYIARRSTDNPSFAADAERFVETVGEHLGLMHRAEELVRNDPSLFAKLEAITAANAKQVALAP